MTYTTSDILDQAEALAGGSLALHSQMQTGVMEALPAETVESVAGMGETALAVEYVAQAAQDLAAVFDAALADEELSGGEKGVLADRARTLQVSSDSTQSLAAVVVAEMPAELRASEEGILFKIVGVDGMKVVDLQLRRLVHMTVQWLKEGETDPPEPDPEENPDYQNVHPGVDYDEGGGQAMAWALRRAISGEAHPCWAPGKLSDGRETLDVFMPKRRTRGVALGGSGWSELPQVGVAGVGSKTIRIFGHPETSHEGSIGTHVEWNHTSGTNGPYGGSMLIRAGGGWEGRVHMHDLIVECSPKNGISGGKYGSQDKVPLEDVWLVRGRLVDGPHRCLQPISFNQTRLHRYKTVHDTPMSWEHSEYTRNPVGDSSVGVRAIAAGGQTYQTVSRKSEGPQYPRFTQVVQDYVGHNHHRDPSRRGTYETIAGSGHDHVYRNCLFYEILEDGRPHGEGLFVVWNGGNGKSWKLESGKTNGIALAEDAVFLIRKPHKAPLKFHDCEGLEFKDCHVYVEPSPNRTVDIHDGFPVTWTNCNATPLADRLQRFVDDDMIDAATREKLLSFNWQEPSIRLIDQGKVIGPVSDDYTRG